MVARSGGVGADDHCAKRVWVMTVLSDDESFGPDQALPPGLEFHLSRCPECRALADELLAVTSGLSGLAATAAPAGLLDRANTQAGAALAAGGELTGRVDPGDEGCELLTAPKGAAWRRWTMPLAIAALLALAAGVVAVMRAATDPGDGAGRPIAEAPAVEREVDEPEASLVRDGVAPRDPTAVPEAYRGESCDGDDCVERAFVPGRGRRSAESREVDRSNGKGSTTPAPDDR